MASLFKKKTVDGEWGAGPPAPGREPRRPSRSPGGGRPPPALVPSRLGSWSRPGPRAGGAGARGWWRCPRGGLGPCVPAERELAGRGGGHGPRGVTHRRRSGQAGRVPGPGRLGPPRQRGVGFPRRRALWGGRAGARCGGSRALVNPVCGGGRRNNVPGWQRGNTAGPRRVAGAGNEQGRERCCRREPALCGGEEAAEHGRRLREPLEQRPSCRLPPWLLYAGLKRSRSWMFSPSVCRRSS